MAPREARRIVVIQTAFLGDIVLTSAFLANLRALAPKAEICFVTTPVGARLFTPNEWGIKLVPYDKRGQDAGPSGFLRLARSLRHFRPELVFCLHRSIRSTFLARVSGGEIYGFADAAGAPLFHRRVRRKKGAFEAEKNQQLLVEWAGAAAAAQPLHPRLSASAEEATQAAALLGGRSGFLAIAPSSVWATKRWPAARFAEAARALGKKHGLATVIVGGSEPADIESAKQVEEALGGEALNLAGKTNLGVLKAVLAKARLVITNDSAPLHIAIAMGAPVLGVFGPTTKELGFFPLAPEGMSGVAELPSLACRPCGLHGHNECPLGHFKCMLELPPELVVREAEKLLCR